MGLFDNLVKYGDQVKSVQDHLQLASSDPIVTGVKTAISLLPDGGLKDWLSANPGSFWKKVLQIFTGKKWQVGNYRVGERYLDQVIDNGNPDYATSYGKVPDEVVPEAQTFMTMAFGVRITNQEDLDALEQGFDAYKARPDKADIPDAAIRRAVRLKQMYYPDSTYNKTKWDLSWFEKNPLVAPIPGLVPNTLYTGELPGGAVAKDGVISGDSIIKQVLNGTPVPVPGTPEGAEPGHSSALLWLIGGGMLLYLVSRKKRTR